MNRGIVWLSGFSLGAGLMYFLDPSAGRRRRAQLRDRTAHLVGQLEHYLDMAARDVYHRAQGLAAESRALLDSHDAPDDVLIERVRSKIGHCVSHPHVIAVEAHEGRVVLRGPILARDVSALLACVASIRGVVAVEDQLEVHRHAGTEPRLQGGRERGGSSPPQTHWSAPTRLLACAIGCGLMGNCLARRTPLAALLGTVGFGLCVRGVTNLELKHLTAIGGGLRAFGLHGSRGSATQAAGEKPASGRNGNGRRHSPRKPELGAEGQGF